MSKVTSLKEAANLIQNGDTISTGGSLLHRNPSAMLREIIRQGRKNLTLIKHSPGYALSLKQYKLIVLQKV